MFKFLNNSSLLSLSLGASLTLMSCGEKNSGSSSSSPKGAIEVALEKASAEHNIPKELILATAWLESRMSAEPSSSLYLNTGTPEEASRKGLSNTQTAFGIPASTLGLEEAEQAASLPAQITAYGQWLGSQIEIEMPTRIKSGEDISQWILMLADLHRGSQSGPNFSSGIRAIFIKEMIETLNNGFIWQDPNSEEFITLKPASPPIELSDLTQTIRDAQNINDLTSLQPPELDFAKFLRLGLSDPNNKNNKPTHIKVIHCPLSFSACLGMQNPNIDEEIRLEAHYIIPNDDKYVRQPLQVLKHHNSVRLTDHKGITNYVNDAIVIMLTGNSGRIVNGYRQPANPNWYNNGQMIQMSNMINDICLFINNGDTTKSSNCVANDVFFQHQGTSDAIRWGDIPDYDPQIFYAYINSPGGLNGNANLSLNKDIYDAGQTIPITLDFRKDVQRIELEELIRCPDNRVIWVNVENRPVRSRTNFVFEREFFEAGPNGNGEQFIRAKVFGEDAKLLGWDVKQIHIQDFQTELATQPADACYSNRL